MSALEGSITGSRGDKKFKVLGISYIKRGLLWKGYL
jgi:hypothetical protein